MLDLVKRMIYDIGYSESASTGRKYAVVEASQTGNQLSCKQKISSRIVAKTNEGTETNSVVKKMITRSGHLLRDSAASEPSITPTTTAAAAAIPPSLAEMAKLVQIVVAMSRPVFSGAKSRAAGPIKFINCAPRVSHGWAATRCEPAWRRALPCQTAAGARSSIEVVLLINTVRLRAVAFEQLPLGGSPAESRVTGASRPNAPLFGRLP